MIQRTGLQALKKTATTSIFNSGTGVTRLFVAAVKPIQREWNSDGAELRPLQCCPAKGGASRCRCSSLQIICFCWPDFVGSMAVCTADTISLQLLFWKRRRLACVSSVCEMEAKGHCTEKRSRLFSSTAVHFWVGLSSVMLKEAQVLCGV